MTDAYTPTLGSEDPTPGWSPMFVPEAEPDRIDRESPYYAASQGLALRETFEDAQLSGRLFGFLDADAGRRFGAHQRRMFGEEAPALLSPDEANERFGVAGRLSFDAPVDRNIAAWRQGLAQREAFRDEVVANAGLSWWQVLGTSFAGSLVDPAGVPLWLAPELAAGRALRTGAAASRLARLPGVARGAITGAAEGVAGGVVYEAANLWLHHEAADDYDFGQASANVIFGGLLGAAAGGLGGWWEGRGAGPRAPEAVQGLDESEALGAFVEALEAVADDRPVDLGPVLRQEAERRETGQYEPERLRALDDGAAGEVGAIPGQPLGEAVAVTPRGEEVPVRFKLVEADDLTTSHDDDLFPNPDYPSELQPRRRDRAGAQARNRQLEADLNPKRLMTDAGAETGAPVIAPDGTVESGNGRTIAIRRSYATGSEAAKRYRAELEARGYDVSGMRAPVLVRERLSVLDGAGRVKLTRDMNQEATEAYSPSERAAADAGSLDDGLLALIEGADLNSAANRRFVRGFLDRVASDDLNRMTTADGRLSDAGLARIEAAMVARAYGHRGLTEALFEATDSNIRAIGKALAQAAPEWAAMKAAVARGEVPAELDLTASLTAAVDFVRAVRARRGNIGEAMDLIVGQTDAFSGEAMTVETEAFVRMFFRTDKEGATLWKSPRGADSLADGLRWLAGETRKVQPGPDLFGDAADAATGRRILDGLGQWFARQSDGAEGHPLADLFAPDDAGGDVRTPVVETGREPGGQGAGEQAASPVDVLKEDARPEPPDRGPSPYAWHPSYGTAEHWAEFQRTNTNLATPARYKGLYGVSPPKTPKGQTPPPPKGEPFADPELKDLQADTAALLAREGLEPIEGQDPQSIADAIAAGAACLKVNGG